MRRSDGSILISASGCDFGRSGIGVFARELIPRLVAILASNDVPVRVVGTTGELSGLGLSLNGGTSLRLPGLFNPPGVNAVGSLLGLPALAHAMRARALYLPAANRRVVLPTSIPTVGTVHDLAQFHMTHKYGRLRDGYVRRVLAPMIRGLARVLAVSEATAQDVVRFSAVDRQRVRVVPNGVSLPEPSKLSAPQRRPYLLYPARLEHPGKNHARLIEAFGRSSASRSHDLILTGKDWGAEARVRTCIHRLGLDGRVQVQGYLSRDELTRWMTHADAVVAAGLREGFGLPAAEALSLGRPLACSSTGSLPEVAGELAVFFDPYQVDDMAAALDRVLTDRTFRRRVGAEGPKRAARFSWDRCASAVAESLLEAVE